MGKQRTPLGKTPKEVDSVLDLVMMGAMLKFHEL
jgi:hypothetical protein